MLLIPVFPLVSTSLSNQNGAMYELPKTGNG